MRSIPELIRQSIYDELFSPVKIRFELNISLVTSSNLGLLTRSRPLKPKPPKKLSPHLREFCNVDHAKIPTGLEEIMDALQKNLGIKSHSQSRK